jgi:hypothetical protein
VVRRLLLWVLMLGMTGTVADLLLLAHYEDWAQLVPLVLLIIGLGLGIWHFVRPTAPNLRALQIVMGLFVAAGAIGVGFHLTGAAEFQREIDPTAGWWPLLRKAARSQAPPLLAPGTMVQLGLIGFIYTFRHPITHPATLNGEEVHR